MGARAPYTANMAPKYMIHFEDGVSTYASMGNFLMTVSVGPLTMLHISQLQRILDEIRHKSPTGKTVGISIARMEKVSMPADVRDKLHECMKQWKTTTGAAATVLDGTGVASAAIRAVVTAMSLVSRSGFPSKTFAKAEDAVTWVLPYCDASWTAADKEECRRRVLELDQKHRVAKSA